MLFYYTKVQVNELMTPSLLIEQVIYWIQHTKNKMKDLNYDHSLYYSLKEKHKSLEIKDFKTKNILGIQFITDHNYKKNQFTIEILYHYQQEILELSFYKEISNESKYISKISIPKIFPMILESNYIQKDHDLSIQSTPHFINERTVNQHIRYYMLQENEFYSFSELQQFELLQSYQDDAISSVEVQELFLNEIKNIEKDIIDLQKEYQNKKDILEKLTNINQEYNHLLKQDDEALITIHQDNYKEYQEYIFSIIHKTLMNLSPDDTYRKRDLLKSIERKHQL